MPKRSVVVLRRLRRISRMQDRRANMVNADPPIMLPTIVPTLEGGVGRGCSACDVLSEELEFVTIPIDGDMEGAFDGTVLELIEVLKENAALRVVSGEAGSADEKDKTELVNGTGGVHMLLGASECCERCPDDSQLVEMGIIFIGLDSAVVVGFHVGTEDSETIDAVVLGVGIAPP